jgi:molybdopterin-containing oxidoreductase family iron-sulfur binding subunit
MPVGQGHQDYGRYASGQGSNPLDLVAADHDEETGALGWGATRVRIIPTGEQRTLARLESAEGIAFLSGEEH